MRNLIKNPVDTLFLGTDWESVETLRSLYKDSRYNIIGVITKSDSLVGRNKILTPSLVKEFAIKNNLKVFHTDSNKDKYKEVLDILKPELIICKAFGEILPKFFIDYPKYGSINIHFSLLPKYRGAVPIQKAILEGESKTGISIMLMSEGLDEGDILEQYEKYILKNDTNITLRERLVKRSSNVLGETLERWISGDIKSRKQEHEKATYCWQKDISKENAEILWNKYSPEYIERMVRALVPWPVAWTIHKNKRIKLFDVEIIKLENNKVPGELFVSKKDLLFATKEKGKCIKVNELQLEGKEKVLAKDFINGFLSASIQ